MYILLFLLETGCFLAGCLLWRKAWPLQYKMLVVLMGLTVLVERSAYVLGQSYHQNVWLLNLFVPLESASYIFVFYRESASPAFRWFCRCLLAVLFPAVLVTYLLHPHLFLFNLYGYIVGLFLLLLAAAAYFVEYMLGETDNNLTGHPLFWLAAGTIPFCCIHILLFSLLTYLVTMRVAYFYNANLLANLFLYGGLTGSFVSAHYKLPYPS